jgi:hypothetical protein
MASNAELDVATSNLLAKMANHVGELTKKPSLSYDESSTGPAGAIQDFVDRNHLPTTAEAAASDEGCRARAGGILHALIKFETEYKRDISTDGDRAEDGSTSDRICIGAGRSAAEMNFGAAWREFSAKERTLSEAGEIPEYWGGVLSTLRTLTRSVEICLEQVVIEQVTKLDAADKSDEGADPHIPERIELSSLLFVALTSAPRSRLERALGSTHYDNRVVDSLVQQGFLNESDETPAMHISPAGATHARVIMDNIA